MILLILIGSNNIVNWPLLEELWLIVKVTRQIDFYPYYLNLEHKMKLEIYSKRHLKEEYLKKYDLLILF